MNNFKTALNLITKVLKFLITISFVIITSKPYVGMSFCRYCLLYLQFVFCNPYIPIGPFIHVCIQHLSAYDSILEEPLKIQTLAHRLCYLLFIFMQCQKYNKTTLTHTHTRAHTVAVTTALASAAVFPLPHHHRATKDISHKTVIPNSNLSKKFCTKNEIFMTIYIL